MWIEELENGKYKYVERYTDYLTGKIKKVSVTLPGNDRKSNKLATQLLNDKIDAILSASDTSKLRFSALVDNYLTYQQNNVKLATYTRNKGVCNTFLKMFGADTLVCNMSAGFIKDKFERSGASKGKKNEWLKRLKALLRWGYENDFIDDISYINKLKPYEDSTAKQKRQQKYLEVEEIALLFDDLSKNECYYYYDLTRFLVLSGLRIGEAIALEKSDIYDNMIHIERNFDLVNKIFVDSVKTETSEREIFIQSELREVLDDIKRHNRMNKISTKYLFSVDGNHIDYNNYRIFLSRHSKKVIGRSITPHTLRHTHASLLFANGFTLDEVSRRLGHSDSGVTTEIYVHIMQKLKQKDKDKLKDVKLL